MNELELGHRAHVWQQYVNACFRHVHLCQARGLDASVVLSFT